MPGKKRGIVLFAACIALAGCNNSKELLSDSQTYLLMTDKGSSKCYTRIIDGFPRDQVCQKRDFLRYTDAPVLKFSPQVPNHVIALFDAHTKRSPYRERIREWRRNRKQKAYEAENTVIH